MPRTKGATFSPLEHETLIELVEKRKTTIENKANNATIIKKKEEAWKSLATEFNARFGVSKRNQKQLKNSWKNLKANTKKAFANGRIEKAKIGGGSKPISDEIIKVEIETDIDDVFTRVKSVMPSHINSLQNPFYDDTSYHGHGDNVCRICSATPQTNNSVEMDVTNVADLKNEVPGGGGNPEDTLIASLNLAPVSASLKACPGDATASETIPITQFYTGSHSMSCCSLEKENNELLKQTYLLKLENIREEHELVMSILNKKEQRNSELFELKKQVLIAARERLENKCPDNKSDVDDAVENVEMIENVKVYSPNTSM